MSFVSLPFALFVCVAFVCYWKAAERSILVRNVVLVAVNLVFYALLDLRMAPLLVVAISADYVVGRLIGASTSRAGRRAWLLAGLALNLLPLAYFKYSSFLLEPLAASALPWAQRALLPIGISFYTFAKVSYLIDVYRATVPAERDFCAFFAYLSFFPNVIAGPIERATTLLPQIKRRADVGEEAFADGIRQFLWGALKKVVVADNLVVLVDRLFGRAGQAGGGELAVGALLFSAQIYCDFSGYSEMAQGMARCLGLELTRNFAYPYFSRDIAEFWRRWHVSLSSWFRDYVFFPLGANYRGKARWCLNILVTFALCGLWHGANWTFVAWGVLIGVYFLPLVARPPQAKRSRIVARGRLWPTTRESLQVAGTFAQVTLAWVLFRAESFGQAVSYLGGMVTRSWTDYPLLGQWSREHDPYLTVLLPVLLAAGVFLVEWLQRERRHGLAIASAPAWVRWSVCYAALALLLLLAPEQPVRFLYADF